MKVLKLLITALVLISCRLYGSPRVENGRLDLSGRDFDREGSVKICDGSQLNLTPSLYDRKTDTAVFSLTIILPDRNSKGNSLALMIPPMLSPYNLSINGNAVLSNNYNYISHWNVRYSDRSNILPLLNYKGRLNLFLKIFNFSDIRMIRDPILIGQEKDIRELRWLILFREGFIEGAMIIVFIINLLLWLGHRKNYSFLTLGLFSFFQALNLMGRGETLNFLSDIPPGILIKMQLVFLFVKLTMLNSFFMTLFNNVQNRIIVRLLSALTIIVTVSVFFTGEQIYYCLLFYYLFMTATLFYNAASSPFYLSRNRTKSLVSLLSTAVFLISYLIYIIQYRIYFFSLSAIINGQQDTLSYGILFFIFANTFYQYITVTRKIDLTGSLPLDDLVLKFRISKRECDILELLIKRYSYKEISDKLFISNKTVETHVYHIYQKTGAKNKTELIKMIESIIPQKT